MFTDLPKKHRVPFDQTFRIAEVQTTPPEDNKLDSDRLKKRLKKEAKRLYDLQRVLYANDKHALLIIFQAMDAAGKDSTIRHVMRRVNPAGCQVYSFKQPSDEELDHDFLWRTSQRLPERGRIGIFNRSYYEEVLVVRVHDEILEAQKLPRDVDRDTIWEDRYESIRCHEAHLARNGVVILKFWLNVSPEEQKRRFYARLDRPEKNWKFSPSDVAERRHWGKYMAAYEQALNATSRPWAPWYAIPADNKPYMRATVARIIRRTLDRMELEYPSVSEADLVKFEKCRQLLDEE
ncbi:MAG: PPK2 family polyphosphate kinase [Methylohalobius sp. ZOD2]